jgi:hypothetical protein
VKAVLIAGLAMACIDRLRPFLERIGKNTLTDISHLRRLIPQLSDEEFDLLWKECKGQLLLVIFDGTTKVDEVFTIVFRWVDRDTLTIHQRCVHVGKYQKSFNHEELVFAVMTQLGRYDVDQGTNQRVGNVLGFMRDRASVNNCAVTLLLHNYYGSRDGACISHTLTHVGDHFKVKLLLKFKEDLCALMKSSYQMHNHWTRSLGITFKHPGNTRWWATGELYFFMHSRW